MKNVLVLTYWSYNDALIQTYTLPYARMISKYAAPGKLFLVTLEQGSNSVAGPFTAGNIHVIPFKYHGFGIRAMFAWIAYFFRLLALIRKEKITHLHCWCTPAGAIGWMLSLLTGKPLIIDSYEPHAEAMVENGTWKKSSMAFRLLFYLEKRQSKRATAVIALTRTMRDYAKQRYGAELKQYFVKPACVDTADFRPRTPEEIMRMRGKLGLNDKLVCVYAGKVGGIYLTREIFDFFAAAARYWGPRFHALMLTNTPAGEAMRMAEESGLDKSSLTVMFVPHKEVSDHMGMADFALNPVKPVYTKRFCTSIKDGEYWATGLPVVITKNISDDSEIIEQQNIGAVIEELTEPGYTEAVKKIDRLLSEGTREQLSERIRNIAEQYRTYSIAEDIYRKLYSNMHL